jgi:hypothetical protein
MKRVFYLWLIANLLLISSTAAAKAHYNKMGGTHYTRPYIKKSGTFVQGHHSGNPGSGIHCHDGICY